MKIYLDNCCLQRPLDDRSQLRIALEAEAVLSILALCEAGTVDLISSEALMFETQKNPDKSRREYAIEVLRQAKSFIHVYEAIESRSQEFIKVGIKPLDALHLASAEHAQADYICTTDDKFLKKAKALKEIKTKVISPLQLVEEIIP
jgi:predicted nucleic acid-binding protein